MFMENNIPRNKDFSKAKIKEFVPFGGRRITK